MVILLEITKVQWIIGDCFGIDPNDPNTIYAAGALSIFKSTDSGTNWTEISEWRGTGFSQPYVHADHHNIVFIDSDKILFSNDGGVFLTTDGGNTFTMKNDNMVTTQFYSTAIHPTTSDYVLGGAQDNGTWKIKYYWEARRIRSLWRRWSLYPH